MVIAPSLRHIMADSSTLKAYSNGKRPAFKKIETQLFLLERQMDTSLPDHYFRRGKEFVLKGIQSISQLMTEGFKRLGEGHLHLVGNTIEVRTEALQDWQDLLTLCTPLPCISAVLWHQSFVSGTCDVTEIVKFMRTHIVPNSRYSCLPPPSFSELGKLHSHKGFYDLHVHLNGSTETDSAWQSFLHKPFEVYREILSVSHNQKVKELFSQDPLVAETPYDIYCLLKKAAGIRQIIVQKLFPDISVVNNLEFIKKISTSTFLKHVGNDELIVSHSLIHPMKKVFESLGDQEDKWPDISLEAIMYVLIMDRISIDKSVHLSSLFHCYLLILGFMNRLLVQQIRQNGFDQFQKITLSGFRETPEKTYSRRFFQMHGNNLSNLKMIEGRFSPKPTPGKNLQLLKLIIGGWKEFEARCKKEGGQPPRLTLVAHFIKEADRESLSNLPLKKIRHRSLRISTWKKARALVSVLHNSSVMGKFITGVDAAANELETPPEVFAPTYRYLRKKGLVRFTFHAGEDFHHLVGGLRAIYEAVYFLELEQGDRIGHGTAAGIDPGIWLKHVGETFAISEGEWLDDLTFVLHLLEGHPQNDLMNQVSNIHEEVRRLGEKIYGSPFSVRSYITAWRMRRFCPMHMLNSITQAMTSPTWNQDEWKACLKEKSDKEALRLLSLYHQEDSRKKYKNMELINTQKILSETDLFKLQELLLKELCDRKLVIEVPPTSNVRISFYKEHGEHHLFRWMGLDKKNGDKSQKPNVVIGTDDTGIFSTNIYNEYSHIYHQLISQYGLSPSKAQNYIRRLMDNSELYAFSSG